MKKAEKIEIATRIVTEEIDPTELEITGSGTPKNPLQIEIYGKEPWGCGWNAAVDCNKGKITDVDGYGRYQEIEHSCYGKIERVLFLKSRWLNLLRRGTV